MSLRQEAIRYVKWCDGRLMILKKSLLTSNIGNTSTKIRMLQLPSPHDINMIFRSSIAIEEKYQTSLSQVSTILDNASSQKNQYNYIDTSSQQAFNQMKTFGNQTHLVRTAYIEKMKTQVKELTELRVQHEKLARYHRRKIHECNVEYAQCLIGELPKVRQRMWLHNAGAWWILNALIWIGT